jgi:hypothetical protein
MEYGVEGESMTATATRADRDERDSGEAPQHRYASNADESCRMFRSGWMEALSHVRPWVPHAIFIPAIAGAIWLSLGTHSGLQVLGFFAVGLLVWTCTEYTIHRFLFHPPQWIEDDTRRIVGQLRPAEAVMPAMPTWRHKFYFLVHGVHHDYPNDSTRLVMPPSVSVPLSALFCGIFVAIAGDRGIPMFAGFISGYLAYDTIHFATHHVAGRSALSRYLKKRHFRHHYSDSTRDFGVSSPLWDALVGTLGGK